MPSRLSRAVIFGGFILHCHDLVFFFFFLNMRWPLVDPPTEGEWVLLSLTWNFHYVGRDVLLEAIAYL